MGVALATIGSGPMAPVLDLALPGFRALAERHGHTLVVGDGASRGRPPAWAKVDLLRALLDEHDLVVWLDADMLVWDPGDDVAAAVPADAYQALPRTWWSTGEVAVTTGTWALRAGDRARAFLDAVWACDDLVAHPWWEQAAVNRLLGYRVDRPYGAGPPTPWRAGTAWLDPSWNSYHGLPVGDRVRIRHYARLTVDERLRVMGRDRRWLDRLGPAGTAQRYRDAHAFTAPGPAR